MKINNDKAIFFFFKFVISNGPFSHLVMPKIHFNINISKVFFCVLMFIFS